MDLKPCSANTEAAGQPPGSNTDILSACKFRPPAEKNQEDNQFPTPFLPTLPKGRYKYLRIFKKSPRMAVQFVVKLGNEAGGSAFIKAFADFLILSRRNTISNV
jgi:hypothetical protein